MASCDFDQVRSRKGTHSIKWEFTHAFFGSDELLPLWVADMDFPSPPEVVEALSQRAQHGIFGYTGISDDYLKALVEWMKTRHNWDIQPEWNVFTNGVVPALNMVLQTFAKPGDGVVIQPPVYYPFFNAIRNNGQHLLTNTLLEKDGHYTMDVADLEEKLRHPNTTVMILCSPHNPVGRVWTKEEIMLVAHLCLQHDVLLVSDEIHHDLVYPPHRHQVTASLSEAIAGNTITCTAPSKTFNLAGLQCSNILVSDAKKRRRFERTLERNGFFGINPFGEAATIAAYRHGASWLDHLLDYLLSNQRDMAAYLRKHLPQVRINDAEGTYLAWLDFRELHLSRKELEHLIQEKAGLALNHGHVFGVTGEGFQRLNFACPKSILMEAMDRLANAVRAL